MRGGFRAGGLPGGRKGIRAGGSVEAFLKITTHHCCNCSQMGPYLETPVELTIIAGPNLKRKIDSEFTSASKRLLLWYFLTAGRNINQVRCQNPFSGNKSLLKRWCQAIFIDLELCDLVILIFVVKVDEFQYISNPRM